MFFQWGVMPVIKTNEIYQCKNRAEFSQEVKHLSKKSLWRGLIVAKDESGKYCLRDVSVFKVWAAKIAGMFGLSNAANSRLLVDALLGFLDINQAYVPDSDRKELDSLCNRVSYNINHDDSLTQRIETWKQNNQSVFETAQNKQPPVQRAPDTAATSASLSGVDKIFLKDETGNVVQGDLQLAKGNHNIKILHADRGHTRGAVEQLETKHPVYRFSSAKFGLMYQPSSCLVMHKDDFNRIQEKIHNGAFGGDYIFTQDLAIVWKFPADLNEIDGWIVSANIRHENVGEYKMRDDTRDFSERPSAIQGTTDSLDATKFRFDVPTTGNRIQAVHFLSRSDNKTLIPGFSSGNIFADFNAPQPAEKKKISVLLQELEKYGIKSFMCNRAHHLLVFYQTADNQQMTGEKLVELLNGPNSQHIKDALTKASKADFKVEAWATALRQAVARTKAPDFRG